MNIQLIKGNFSGREATDIITQMIDVKIKYHESKIEKSHSEEDIKMRESRIKQLQKDLYELRELIKQKPKRMEMDAVIELH